MALKFAANISTMFREYKFDERFGEASKSGFKWVEFQDPCNLSPNTLKTAMSKANIEVVLMNSLTDGGCGLAAIPGKEMEFSLSLSKTLDYVFALNCKKVHIMAGIDSPDFSDDEKVSTYVNNLQMAADMLEEHLVVGVIEPMCKEVRENYFLSSFTKAVDIIKQVDRQNIKLLLDVYHLHKITGDVKNNLEKYYPYAGHVQVSQDPGRTEPFVDGGQIDYEMVFKFLKSKEHKDCIGLEYTPSSTTADAVKWINVYI